MPRLTTYLQSQVRRLLLARVGRNGIDLSQLEKVPERLSWPLQRDGMNPIERLAELREREPIAKLTSFLGLTIWVVSGEAEARAVLADTTSYSNDIRPFMGSRGSTIDGDIGGLGFTDPPDHTRLRRLLTPEFTMRRLERLRPRIAAIVEQQLDVVQEQARAEGGVVDLVPTFAFPVPFLVICELLGLPDEDRAVVVGMLQEDGGAQREHAGAGLQAAGEHAVGEPGELEVVDVVAVLADDLADQPLAGLLALASGRVHQEAA